MKADPWWKTRYDAMLAAPLSRLPLGVWPFWYEPWICFLLT